MVPDKQIYVPPTISAEAQQVLTALIEARLYATEFPAMRPSPSGRWAGSPWKTSAHVATGLRIISVNYTPAPRAHFAEIQRQLVAVFDALMDAGYAMRDIAIYGESAGGALAASTVLNLRDRGNGLPAAALLWSPNTDLSGRDDSTVTLDPDDPVLTYSTLLVSGSRAYAGDVALDDPRVSPLYADLSRGFAPTLIVVGTKEMLLSSSVRFYQALEAAGQSVKLDVYEGMWHVFPQYGLPESRVAVEKSAKFNQRPPAPMNAQP